MPTALRRLAVSANQAQPLRPVHRSNAGPHLSHALPSIRHDGQWSVRTNVAHRSVDDATFAEPSTSGRPSAGTQPVQRMPIRRQAYGDELSMSGALSRPASGSFDDGASQPARRTARVRFWLKFRTEYGQSVRVVGSHEQLGSWNLLAAPALRWSEGDLWNTTIDLPAGGVFEYKYAVVSGDGRTAAAWQRGNNSVIAVRMDDTELEVFDNWEGNPGAAVVAGGTSTTREGRLLNWASEMEAILTAQRNELRETRMQLFEAQEEARSARQDAVQLRTDLILATQARLEAERKLSVVEVENTQLRMELTRKSHEFKLALEECKNLLGGLGEVAEDTIQATLPSAAPPNSTLNSNSSSMPKRPPTTFQSPTSPPPPPPSASTQSVPMNGVQPARPRQPGPNKLPFGSFFPNGRSQTPPPPAAGSQWQTGQRFNPNTPPPQQKFTQQPPNARPPPPRPSTGTNGSNGSSQAVKSPRHLIKV